MSKVEIREVASKRDLKKFVKVPFLVHRDHPEWVPPLIMDRMEFLNRSKNPYFDHAEVGLWIAEKNGVPVEYIVFADEGHGFTKKKNQTEGYGAVLRFLDTHLKEKSGVTFTPHVAEGG